MYYSLKKNNKNTSESIITYGRKCKGIFFCSQDGDEFYNHEVMEERVMETINTVNYVKSFAGS